MRPWLWWIVVLLVVSGVIAWRPSDAPIFYVLLVVVPTGYVIFRTNERREAKKETGCAEAVFVSTAMDLVDLLELGYVLDSSSPNR